MESLEADFVQFSNIISKFLVLKARPNMSTPSLEIFLTFSHFLRSYVFIENFLWQIVSKNSFFFNNA